jgi:hypothetical protein
MSYREENGQVIVTLKIEDFESLLGIVATAHGLSLLHRRGEFGLYNTKRIVELVNLLNEGRPDWLPYRISSPSPDCADLTHNAKGK